MILNLANQRDPARRKFDRVSLIVINRLKETDSVENTNGIENQR